MYFIFIAEKGENKSKSKILLKLFFKATNQLILNLIHPTNHP